MKNVHRKLQPLIDQLNFKRTIVLADATSSQRPGVYIFDFTDP